MIFLVSLFSFANPELSMYVVEYNTIGLRIQGVTLSLNTSFLFCNFPGPVRMPMYVGSLEHYFCEGAPDSGDGQPEINEF